ncbi:3103_t:CDS:2, partial [Acaulospora morrowiae]
VVIRKVTFPRTQRDENVVAPKQNVNRETASNISNALPSKKITTNVYTQHKRAALNDVSNISNIPVINSKHTTTNQLDVVAIKQTSKELAHNQPLKQYTGVVAKKRTVLTERVNIPVPDANKLQQPLIVNAEVDKNRAKKPKTQEWDDLDADDLSDPMMVSEYAVDIFDYLKELEAETMANPRYMEVQTELSWKMRGILVDWLIEVHSKFRLLPETLFLAVNIIDRFLSVRVVSLIKLQLVGITGLFIASKYEEVMAPSIKNFIYMADNGYTEEEILKAERYVLQTIDFKLCYPNPMNFLRRTSKADNFDVQSRTVAKYLMEISLVDQRFLSMTPSMIAAAALYLARKMLNRSEWNINLIHYSTFTEEELQPCVRLMLDYLVKP